MLDLCIRVEDVNTYNNILMDSLLRYYQDLGRAKKRKRKGISQRHKLIQKFAKIKIWSKFDIQLSFSLFPFLPFHFLSVYFCFYNFFFYDEVILWYLSEKTSPQKYNAQLYKWSDTFLEENRTKKLEKTNSALCQWTPRAFVFIKLANWIVSIS